MSTSNPSKPTHLDPSALGTKEYWDKLYTTEITNHAHDPTDTGTVWFDDSDAEAKLLSFLEDLSQDYPAAGSDSRGRVTIAVSEEETSFLDLGTGNGSLLFSLRDAGWAGRMLGVDYSELSVELAKRIERSRRVGGDGEQEERTNTDTDTETGAGTERETETETEASEVEFLQWDVLNGSFSAVLTPDTAQSSGWDVVLDKGTFDAISLSDERDSTGRRICEQYRGRVLRLVREGGLFIVTSCNWTEAELKAWFEGVRDEDQSGDVRLGGFELAGRVDYKSFSFGGVKGQTISSLCFVRTKAER